MRDGLQADQVVIPTSCSNDIELGISLNAYYFYFLDGLYRPIGHGIIGRDHPEFSTLLYGLTVDFVDNHHPFTRRIEKDLSIGKKAAVAVRGRN